MQKKYSIGLVIGRFQPFHNGHLYLLQQALRYCDKLIIGIGSSNVQNADNPLSYEERRKMLKSVIRHEQLQASIIQIIPIPDVPDDHVWLKETVKTAKKFDVVFGNNDWVNGIFAAAGFPIVTVAHSNRDALEGRKIRQLLQQNKPWESRVPQYLVPDIKAALSQSI